MNFPVGYEYNENTCEVEGNITGVSKTNICVHPGGSNTRYRSYDESTRKTIKSPMASTHECVAGTHNPGVPGRSQITRLPITMEFLWLTEVTASL